MNKYYVGIRDSKNGHYYLEYEFDAEEEAKKVFEETRRVLETIDPEFNHFDGYLSVEDEDGNCDTLEWC